MIKTSEHVVRRTIHNPSPLDFMTGESGWADPAPTRGPCAPGEHEWALREEAAHASEAVELSPVARLLLAFGGAYPTPTMASTITVERGLRCKRCDAESDVATEHTEFHGEDE